MNQLKLDAHCAAILDKVIDSKNGLPDPVFALVSKLTPLVNIDLLVSCPQNGHLLTWREDLVYGPGWHLPGGIIRFKERYEDRIDKVAMSELGCQVSYDPNPLAINQLFASNRDLRGHFISLLFSCEIIGTLSTEIKCFDVNNPENGQWYWHKTCPDNLISQHEIYRKYL